MNVNYLNEELFFKLSQIPLKPLSFAEGIYKGYHNSKHAGEEVEFKEFRQYIRGDDLKKIDWKRSAKQNQFFVRNFEEELNYKIHLILDQSASMNQKGNSKNSKLEYGKYLLTALAYLFLKQGDQVQVSAFSRQLSTIFSFNNNIKQLLLLNEKLNQLQANHNSNFSLLLNNAQTSRSEKWIIIIFSDFICDLNILTSILSKINSPRNRIILFQLVGNEELDFPFKGEVEFLDPESGETFSCSAGQIKDKFLDQWKDYTNKLRHWTEDQDIELRELNTQVHYSENLLDFIKSYHLKQ